MPYHLPGHNYIGPGTDDFNKPPVDSDDSIARTHDLDYAAARSNQEIRDADWKAIREFGADAVSNYNLHSLSGAVGLGTKYAIETLTGVQYPKSEYSPDSP